MTTEARALPLTPLGVGARSMLRAGVLRAGVIGVGLLGVGVAACGAESSGVEVVDASQNLELALAAASDAEAFRVEGFLGQTIDVDLLGAPIDVAIDPSRPQTVSEVDAEGDSRNVVDVATIVPGSPIDDLLIEFVTVGDTLYGDTTSYAALLELDPTADLGPFRPGRWFADLDAIAGGDAAIIAAIGGSTLDPSELGSALLGDVGPVVSDPDDPTRFTATTTYPAVLGALGQDVEVTARSAAEGVALNLGVDVTALGDFYIDVYENAPTSIAFTIVDGDLTALDIDVDLSAVWRDMPQRAGELGFPVPDDEMAQFEDATADAVYAVRQRFEFFPDPTIEVEPFDGELEDRTADLAVFMDGVIGE